MSLRKPSLNCPPPCLGLIYFLCFPRYGATSHKDRNPICSGPKAQRSKGKGSEGGAPLPLKITVPKKRLADNLEQSRTGQC